jgi:hypothetical protein
MQMVLGFHGRGRIMELLCSWVQAEIGGANPPPQAEIGGANPKPRLRNRQPPRQAGSSTEERGEWAGENGRTEKRKEKKGKRERKKKKLYIGSVKNNKIIDKECTVAFYF